MIEIQSCAHILLSNEKVVFTPHIAFYSQDALEQILDTTASDIIKFEEDTPQYIVNDID